ncbi:MAG TPA: hypothetical protein DIS79_05610 [Bacteroidetes bacterium]|nr:hypothetical protein [Bacteroidota bacterium]HRK04865.1 pitrilysin family protein [Chlorobiota bacterium]
MPHIHSDRFTLQNGLRVVVCPDHRTPVVTVLVMYRVGSADEQPGKTGLAHLFEHLMFDNTTSGIDKQYDLYCARAGGSNNAYTTYDYTTYFVSLPAHQVELGMWLEAERMRDFRITDKALSTQRSVVIEEINQNVENQPYGVWRRLVEEASYLPASSYSWEVYGSADDVAGVTMDDARSFFDTFYAPSNAVLVLSGDITVEHAHELAERHFGTIQARSGPQKRNVFVADHERKGSKLVSHDNAPLPSVFLAVHAPGWKDDQLYAAEIATTVLGSGRTSPLYRRLVKELGIASAADAFTERREHSSLIHVHVHAADPKQSTDDLAAEVIKTCSEFQMTEERRQKAVNKERMTLASELQRTRGVADYVAHVTLFHDDPNIVNTVLDRYENVTSVEIESFIHTLGDMSQVNRVDMVPA